MGASKYTRVGDFTADEAASKGGRAEQDSAQLDGELDAVQIVLDNHANDLDILLRDDGLMTEDILRGHEFSAEAITLLKGLITGSGLNWYGDWATPRDYAIGDLVHESTNAYICLIAHTSGGTFATDLAAGKWELFANGGSSGIPSQVGHADKVLATNGSSLSWLKVAAINTTGIFATSASPTFTGTVNGTALFQLKNGVEFTAGQKVQFGLNTISPSATPAFDLDKGVMHTFTVNAVITTTTTTNRAAGKLIEVRFVADSVDRAVTWNASWKWVGFKPSQIDANKVGILSLRCYGTNETDVVATWNEEL